MKLQQNFITINNQVSEGLNFIVPAQWWKKFLNKNENIHSMKQMRLISQSPLSLLYEVGILDQSQSELNKPFKSMKKSAHQVFISIKKQIKQARNKQKIESTGKRQLNSNQFQFQTNQIYSQAQDFLFYSPKLNEDMIQLFEMGDDSWVLITPELYRLIWLKSHENTKFNKNKKLIAIPIIMRKEEIENCNKRLIPNNHKYFQIYFKKKTGLNFQFEGFIEEGISFNEAISYLDDGLFRFLRGYRQERQASQTKLYSIKSHCSQVYYQLQSEKIFENLGWIHFCQIKDKLLRQSQLNLKIFVLETNIIQENDNQIAHEFSNSQPIKKIKIDTNLQSLFEENQIMKSRKNFQILDFVSLNQQIQIQIIDQENHRTNSQTDIETFESAQRKFNPPNNSSLSTQPNLSRIPYAIWKQNHQTQHLVKYCHLKITVPKIFKPYCDQSTLVLKEEGKKTALTRSCNKLIKKEDLLIQEQIETPQVELNEEPPSESVRRQLQILALQILGIKITENILDVKKIEEIDWAKQNSDEEIKTCKNEFMDQFDCEQSRQY